MLFRAMAREKKIFLGKEGANSLMAIEGGEQFPPSALHKPRGDEGWGEGGDRREEED